MIIKEITTTEAQAFCDKVRQKCLGLSGALKCGVDKCFSDGRAGVALIKGISVRLYAQSFEFVDEVISSLKKGRMYEFCGIDPIVADYILKTRSCLWRTDCTQFTYCKSSVAQPKLANGERLDEINPKYIKLINDHYTYKHKGSKAELLREITSRFSTALYLEDKPVAWALIHDDLAMGVMFVLPEYRRRGYAEAVTCDLMRKVLEKGDIPYVQIVKGNIASETLAKKLGFEPQCSITWIGVRL